MGDLVVGDGEGAAGAGVQQLPAGALDAASLAHGQQARVAQDAVDVNAAAGGTDAVLGHHQHLGTDAASGADDAAGGGVDGGDVVADGGMIGAEPLQVVVQVGQVDQGQVRATSTQHQRGARRDPVGRADVGGRPPEVEEWEGTELGLDLPV
jgi:hypothetical protein